VGTLEAVEEEGTARGRSSKQRLPDVVASAVRSIAEEHLCTYVEQLAREEASALLSEQVQRGEMLGMATTPSVIEGYDISHLSGTNSVANRVVFVAGRPDKNRYHRYKLASNTGSPYDYASIKGVLMRRFLTSRSKKELLPHLVLIDGGPGQLSAAVSVLEEVVSADGAVMALGGSGVGVIVTGAPILISPKREEEVFTVDKIEAVEVNGEYGEAAGLS